MNLNRHFLPFRALPPHAKLVLFPALLLLGEALHGGTQMSAVARADEAPMRRVSRIQGPVTQLVLLGTGTPNAEPDRWGPSLAVVVNGTPYLVDAGAGVVRRAAAAHEAGVEGMKVSRLSTVFLTHLHTDHTVGLPDLMFTPWVLERGQPLRVFGPPGTERMAGHLREAYREDIAVRLDGLEPANHRGHQVVARDVSPGVIHEDENVRVTAFPVLHGSWPLALGYRFETPDRTIVISGDARPSPEIARQCQGCDILVHEVYAEAGWREREPVWRRYHRDSHTSGPELGRIAAQAQPRLLVLTHQLLWSATPEELLAEIRAGFGGTVAYGKDLDTF
jgi:ribonuclease BN (tRNA processing enzyme)